MHYYIKPKKMNQTINSGIQVLNAVPLTVTELEVIEGGGCSGLTYACGAGIALSIFTGGLGALMFGPATGGVCYAAYKCQ